MIQLLLATVLGKLPASGSGSRNKSMEMRVFLKLN